MVLAALIRAVVVLAIALLGSISPLATSVTYGYDGPDSTATSVADHAGDAAPDLLVRGRSPTPRDFNRRYDDRSQLARASASLRLSIGRKHGTDRERPQRGVRNGAEPFGLGPERSCAFQPSERGAG